MPQLTANGGFFFVGLFSFLQPHSLSVTTPTEFLPYGWTTTDLWCAPFITGLFALLTHAQPFWADAHSAVSGWLQGSANGVGEVAALDAETARAVCALVLAVMFSTRATRNFGGSEQKEKEVTKEKVQ